MEPDNLHIPMTAAERQRKRRQKLKDEGRYDEYKKKHLEDVRKSRGKKKAEILALPKSVQDKLHKVKKQAIKKRVALFRAKKKEETMRNKDNNKSPIFQYSASALGKATARVRRVLPSTPRRKKEVVRRLFYLEVNDQQITSETQAAQKDQPHASTISSEVIELVTQFYQRDDISRQAPGRKDSVKVKQTDGSKTTVQSRHLLYSVTETLNLFRIDYPEAKIGRSKFAELRPTHVLLSSKLPHNVCLCKYHENFISAINQLHKAIPDTIPAYSYSFPESIICDPATLDCWTNKCGLCKNGLGFHNKYITKEVEEDHQPVKWHEWRNDSNNQIQKVLEEGTLQDLIEHVSDQTPGFLEHCYVKRHQAKAYNEQRRMATEVEPGSLQKTALIQVDFSENFTCKYQDEIQSAHWNQNQVSLFTAAIWYSGKLHSGVLASDNTTHTKDTVIPYMDKIFEDLPIEIEEVNVWSDGPSSQFKSKYIAAGISVLQEKYDFTLYWNYFATSHGKGPVDGIGGSVKRQVWTNVSNRKHIVQNASSFVVAANDNSKVTVIDVTPDEIERRYKSLNLKYVFENAVQIEGISKVHCLVVQDGNLTKHMLTNDMTKETTISSNIAIGDWYFVQYDGKLYPGEVRDIDHGRREYLVSVMTAVGQNWKWPEKADVIYYTRDKLVQKLNIPTVINARGHFSFNK